MGNLRHYGVDLDEMPEGSMTFDQFLEIWRSFSDEKPEGVQRQRALSWIRGIPKLSLSWSGLPNGQNTHQAVLMFLLRLVDLTRVGHRSIFGNYAFRAAGLMIGNNDKMHRMLHNLPAWVAIQIVVMVRRTRTGFPANEWNKTHNNLTKLVEHIYSLSCGIGPRVGGRNLMYWPEPHAAVRRQLIRFFVCDRPENRNKWVELIERKPPLDCCLFLAQAIVRESISAPTGDRLPAITSQELLNDDQRRVDLYSNLNRLMHFKLFYWLEYLDRIIHLRDHVPLAQIVAVA